MAIELSCLSCPCQFRAAADAPANDVVDRMTEEGPWFGLAAGETFEDMIFTALARRGRILCPDCGDVVAVHESSFGECAEMAMAVG
jgi:hypothetical protein